MRLSSCLGPGCVRSMWQTGVAKEQVLKFYFDGEALPRYAIPALDFYRGKHPLFPAPLASSDEVGLWGGGQRAGNCFVPIPFAKSLENQHARARQLLPRSYERYPQGTR